MKRFFRFSSFSITFVIIFAGIFSYLMGIPFLDIMELKTIDLRFRVRGEISPGSEIVLAVIDEKSLAKEGKWIWPRKKIAKLVEKLSEAGAKVIAFDIAFIEPDENDDQLVQSLTEIKHHIDQIDSRNTDLDNYLNRLRKEADNDQYLSDAIRNSNAKIVLGHFFEMNAQHTQLFDTETIARHEQNIANSKYKLIQFSSEQARAIYIFEGAYPQSNIQQIAEGAEYSGYFNMYPDQDGVVRWIPSVIRFNEAFYMPLSFAAASAFLGETPSIKIAEYGISQLNIGSKPIPVDELGRVFINYRGSEKRFEHISITDILNDAVPREKLKDRLVFVGATAIGIYDMRVTPFGNTYPGIEIHANIVDSILDQDFLRQPQWLAIFDLLAIIIGGTILGLILPKTGVFIGALSGLILFFGYIGSSHFLFARHGLIINMVYPLSVFLMIYVSITAYRFLTESKQKRFIRNAFSHYLSSSVIQQIIESPDKLALGGEERSITAFFSDIQGFTSISENLSPKALVELINEFLTEMTDIILNYQGTVDKFVGDAIVAFYGAPNYLENQAEVACSASIEMQRRLAELRNIWKTEGKPELRMRIGMNTGPAVIGNMGSRKRMNYTMMGDTVNAAARLEGVNKIYGTDILITRSTFKEIGEQFTLREIDSIRVVGKEAAIEIYELMGYQKEIGNAYQAMIDQYRLGLEAYRRRDWEDAIPIFQVLLDKFPNDGPANTLLKRCKAYAISPPPSYWDGAFVLESK